MKDLYLITTQDGSEFAFYDFKLVEEFIKPLKNGTFYFRKVAIIENKQDLELSTNIRQQNQPQ